MGQVTAKGLPAPSPSPDDNHNNTDIQALAQRLDDILSARTAAQITAFATTDLWTGRLVRQSDSTGTSTRQQTGPYYYDGAAWRPAVGDGHGGTANSPTLTASTSNPALGTSPVQYWDWWMIGPWCLGSFVIVWGTGAPTAGSGDYIVSLPVLPKAWDAPNAAEPVVVGSGHAYDLSLTTGRDLQLVTDGTGLAQCRMRVDNAVANLGAGAPLTLGATGDWIKGSFRYLT